MMDATELRFVTAIAVALALFSVLTLFRLTLLVRWTRDERLHWLRDVARDVALALGPLAMLILVWEFWLRAPRLEEMAVAVDKAIGSENADLSSIRSSGIVTVHPPGTLDQAEIRTFMAGARHRLVFLAPWFLDPTAVEAKLKELAGRRGLTIDILLANPKSAYAMERGQTIGGKPTYGPSEIDKSIDALERVRKSSHKGTISVRVFDATPAVYIVIADNRALVGYFSHVGTALATPLLECALVTADGHDTEFGDFVNAEIGKMNTLSAPVVFNDANGTWAVPAKRAASAALQSKGQR